MNSILWSISSNQKKKDGYTEELKDNLDLINENTKYIIENAGNIEITPEGQKMEGIEKFTKKFGHMKIFQIL